ncbi:hypothetical protein NX801_21110 [Streptomyces sp. LP05-1]|uniref:LmbE family protein n=1 Tax=Streptomyces pyxinae TaxID=2970734 RepID=A0ABT2CL32_9ACTN|nr:hypothetical protein [Streptomyces sp. LP05-1]MCS0638107.1 hypothetical protein [Streptomyces sp. LP05-1]
MAVSFVRRTKRQGAGPAPREAAPLPVSDPALPTTTGWLTRGRDGRLTAYAPAADGVLRWTETRPGGPHWSGPVLLPAPGLLPYLSVAQGEDGYVHLAGMRRSRDAEGRPVSDVVYAVQFQTGRPLRDWRALSTPYPDDQELAAQVGVPAAVVDREGALHLFVRNAGGGVCARSQTKTGAWHQWVDLKGNGITGGIRAAVAPDGRTEVLAPAAKRLLRWQRPESRVPFRRCEDLPFAAAAEAPATEPTGDGRLTHFWHDGADATVRAWRPAAPAEPAAGDAGITVDAGTAGDPAEEAPEPAALGTAPGAGPVAVLRAPVDGHDCTILAHRARDTGRPALAAYPTEQESAGVEWTPTGSPCAGAPALALDGRNRVVMAVIGTDGALWVARQKAEAGLALGAWERATTG